MARKSWQQDQEAARHITPAVGKQKEMNVAAHPGLLFIQSPDSNPWNSDSPI